jgi:TonB family protein
MPGTIAAKPRFFYDLPMRKLLTTALSFLLIALALAAGAQPVEAAGPDLKTYPSSDFTDQAYLQKMHKQVGLAWKRPAPPKAGSKAVVIVTILRDGSLLDTRLHMKSGSDAWDASALAAVKSASPFDPLPKSYPRTSVEVHFHFEYN